MDSNNYNREIILGDEKIMTIYFMLETNQKVNYQVFYEKFEATLRTFSNIIADLRKQLELNGLYEAQIIYNRTTKNYELIKAHFKLFDDFSNIK